MWSEMVTLGLLAAGCGPVAGAERSPAAEREACEPSTLIVIPVGEPTPCDLDGSQMLVERYLGSDGVEADKLLADCEWRGGVLLWTALFDESGEFACWAGDY